MAKTQTAHIVITANAKAAVEVMKMLKEQTDIYINRLDALTQKKKQGVQLTKDEEKEAKELEKKIQALTTAQQKNQAEYRKTRDVMKNIAGSTTKDLKRAYAELAKMANNTTGEQTWRQEVLRKKMQEVKAQIDKNTGAINSMSKAQSGFGGALGTTLKNLVAYAGVFQAFGKIKSLISGVFESNLKLSDSLADIRKVAGLSSEAINQLYRNITQIDSRNTIETLNSLAYTGAKLGIGQNYGVEGLTGFVKAAEQVQMALGEDMGEDALPALAKMTEVMGLIDKYGVEQSMQKAASAIFQLGATSTATGTNIVEFSKRLYGLANVSRVSTDDLLALGSAADAMGLMPEVAATAFNKLFTSVQKNHNMIEKTLGLQPGLIKSYYDQGKTMDAIVAIFEKMNQTGNLNLLGNVFKDLGSDGARLVNVMATMSDRVDILRKHLETSRDAFKEGEAVIGEYMIQNQTAQALMERASNLWAKAFTNPEGVDMVKQMAQAWYDLSKSMTQNEGMMYSMRLSIQLIGLAIESLVKLMPVLIHLMMFAGVGMAIRGVVVGIQAMVAAIRAAATAQMTFNAAVRSNALLALVSGIATAIAMFVEYSNAAEEAAKRQAKQEAELKKAFESSKEAVQNVIKPLETYKKVLDQANLTEKQKMEMVKDFNNTYRDYLDYLGIEIKTVDDLRDAYARVVEVMRIKKAYEERESYRTQLNGTNRMDRIGAQAKVESEARSLGIEGINKKYLEGTQNKVKGGVRTSMGTTAVMLDLLKKRYGDNVGLSERGQVYRIETIDKSRPVSASNQRIVNIDVDISGLQEAVNDYIGAYRAERQTNQEVDKMFDSEFTWTDADGKKRKLSDFDIDDYNRKVQEARWKRKGSLDNDAPDKAAIAAAKKAAQETKQAMRKEMQDAEQNVTGIISKLEEYYRLQEAAINEARADGELTESQAAEMVRSLNILKNETLSTARRAVTTGDTTLWDKTKQQLQSYMTDTSEVSQNLLHEIVDADIQALHTSLSKFNGSKDVYGLSAGAFFDQMNAKAAGNQREAARLRAKLQNEVEKALLQYQFVEQAQQKMQADLEKMGFITETYEQLAARLQAGITKKPDTVLPDGTRISDREAFRQMGAKFMQQGVINFRYNIDNEQEAQQWVHQFATNAKGELEGWAQAFPELSRWIGLIKRQEQGETLGEAEQKALEAAMPQIRNLYSEMLNHADRVNKAMKQAFEHEKQQQDIRFQVAGYRKQEEETDRSLEMTGKMKETGVNQTFSEMIGVDKIVDDPEILRIQNRIYWRNQELQEVKRLFEERKAQDEMELEQMRQRGASEQEIETQRMLQKQKNAGLEELMKERQTELFNETANLASQVSQQMQKRAQSIQSLVKPVTDFTQAAGRKIGDMIFNMESEEATWEQLWKNMALAVGESVIQMGAQYAQNLLMQQAMNRASESEAVADAGVKVAAGIAAGSAKTIGELGWWGIPLIAVISAILMGLLQSALSAKSSKDGSSSGSTASATKTKLVSGMLTYDEGNVYAGTDGHVYRATPQPTLPDGVQLIRKPIATTVNGQPSLVAERGPEIIIGRRATRHIQMNEPGLLHHLAAINGHYRTYDQGTVPAGMSFASPSGTSATTPDDSPSGDNPRVAEALEQNTAMMLAMQQTIAALSQTVTTLQQRGIRAHIQKYGADGLIEEVKSGLKFDKRYNR